MGLALSGSLYSLQMASLAGIFGLSFRVMFVNLLALRGYYNRTLAVWLCMGALPYIYGFWQVSYHESQMKTNPPPVMTALLVQTAFPIEECMSCTRQELNKYVIGEWGQIFRTLKPFASEPLDLIALPEYVVPYGAWSPMIKYKELSPLFADIFGSQSLTKLAPLEEPFASLVDGEWQVTSAFILQSLSNLFHTQLVAGVEDAEIVEGRPEYYNAALAFSPGDYSAISRYEKRILVPMGEYIPFEFARALAKKYGVGGSFTPGREARIFQGSKALWLLDLL